MQDPQATSYMALSIAAMAAGKIPPGFNIITGALYEKDKAAIYDKILSGNNVFESRTGCVTRVNRVTHPNRVSINAATLSSSSFVSKPEFGPLRPLSP